MVLFNSSGSSISAHAGRASEKIGRRSTIGAIGSEGSMHFVHHGVAIQPSVSRAGNMFVARVSILEEDGESTSLGNLGQFANSKSAIAFAVRCGIAFADEEPLPVPPCAVRHC